METRLRPLLALVRARPESRRRLVLQKRIVSGLCEIAFNVLKGRVPLNRNQRRNWRRYKNQLRSLTSRRNTYQHKSRLLQQGGFLGLLLPVAKTILTGLAGGLLS